MGQTLEIVNYIDFNKCDRFFPIYIYGDNVDRLREVNVLLEVAEQFVQSGNISAAILAMRHATYLLPHDPKLFNMFASIFYFAAKYEETVECFTCALGLAPKNLYLYIHRALALAHLGDFEEARKDVWAALRLSEKRTAEKAYCLYRAGLIEFLDKKYRDAAIYFWRITLEDSLSADYENCADYRNCMEIARVLRLRHESEKEGEKNESMVLLAK
ncbi:MAG: hypothetical protein A3B04_02620 [Candidatus Portnoybacteria bacterium RIFCSPLOWO2_02_FULL_39_11]|uniref:Uncharacterized protein n=1 Tax=Candidatus Portnoybacteria bacterium RIFCSPLOWO2_02_FULL_39_11 TaxID=1802001 RepID=A0A1G2FVF0_9BACT|nr:MAG: hypothetical protein A3B04_02620 [Candidatus Portnoybacteria bacterium RIFCSPLOWO2_02_FULL_39_11]